jgi:uncharacterized membrane protein
MKTFMLFALWITMIFINHYQKKAKQSRRQQSNVKRPQPKTLEELLMGFSQKVEAVKEQPLIRKNPKKYSSNPIDWIAEDTDVPDMVSEPMEAETMEAEPMVAENMDAEPMIDEDTVAEEQNLTSLSDEDVLNPLTVDNPWKGKLNKNSIKAGFVMAQVLDKPRAIKPFRFVQ